MVLLPLHVEVEGEEGVGVLVVEGGVVVEGVPHPLKRNLIRTWMPTNKRVMTEVFVVFYDFFLSFLVHRSRHGLIHNLFIIYNSLLFFFVFLAMLIFIEFFEIVIREKNIAIVFVGVVYARVCMVIGYGCQDL